jgi:hypothetical protein
VELRAVPTVTAAGVFQVMIGVVFVMGVLVEDPAPEQPASRELIERKAAKAVLITYTFAFIKHLIL